MNITTFNSLKSRNYRLYFSGQSVSLIGTWMQRTAVYWLVFDQTHSNFMLGLVVFATQFPSFLFSPLGGVISDRYNRYRVTLATQTCSMIQATILSIVVLFTDYSIWEIFLLSVVMGIVNAFDLPARQSLVNEVVDDKSNLQNAIALNSSMGKLAWLIGPAISGIILEKLGAGTCFLINAFSYLAVITSLLLMRITPYVPQPHTKKIMKEFKEGFNYLKNNPSLGKIVIMLACVSLFALPFNTLLPVYAKVIFHGTASTYGYLNSAIGLGALVGAILLASLKPGSNLKRLLFINMVILSIALLVFSHISNFSIALCAASLAGFAMMSQTTICNTIIQTEASIEMRGRALSFFAMAFFGMQPLGGLLTGTISQYIGAPYTILAQGIAAIIIAALFFSFLLGKKKNISEMKKTNQPS
nr:MFS transporter [uncultured Bacteroides sp.]